MSDNDVDYHIDEDLEQLFHSDLPNLQLGHETNSHDDVVGDHLPEWLVGVIVVIIMLIIAFFVMVITSIIKNRQKNRSSTYISTPAICDDLESGKIGNGGDVSMKMTSFSSVSEGMMGKLQTANTNTAKTANVNDDKEKLANGVAIADNSGGVQGCRNPLFVDDDLEDKDAVQSVNEDVKTSCSSDVMSDEAKANGGESDGTSKSKQKGSIGKHKHSPQKGKTAQGVPQLPADAYDAQRSEKSQISSKVKSGSQRSSTKDSFKDCTECFAACSKDDGIPLNQNRNGGTSKRGSDESRKIDLESCCEDSGIELCTSESPVRCGLESRSQSLSTEEEEYQSNRPTTKSTFHLTEVMVHGTHAGNLQEDVDFPDSPGDGDCVGDSEFKSTNSRLDQRQDESVHTEQTLVEIHSETNDHGKVDADVSTASIATEGTLMEEINLTDDESTFAMSTNL
ncbi:uncharacterized protein LOC106065811 [Biomphalaria glabrata]|uniref:Uncharacterized protein LOC106065811 n=1 Tax=Biomphalaria glabrata TaxID=6526 RepID=A0A9W3AHX5_BIOGL|nr:uncharacterized protein LOC106065811 [Biomphalaria glabrata]XP_055886861.1 uncharacterized protein LOC106065811 [Biomphalaria glabrata]XP_055886862.1 uncharacterized protein LOC106065811 [Biomphalaria glabrata]